MRTMLSSIALAVTAWTSACGTDGTEAVKSEPAENAKAKAKADTKATGGEIDPAAVQDVLARYEDIRAKLAADDGAVGGDAKALADAATAAAANAGDLGPKLEAIAAASSELAAAPADDIQAVRKQYGEVSKALVDLLAAHPPLQRGHFVFECPMAEGYQKWVQSTDALSNPYMGTKMLECGSASAWSP